MTDQTPPAQPDSSAPQQANGPAPEQPQAPGFPPPVATPSAPPSPDYPQTSQQPAAPQYPQQPAAPQYPQTTQLPATAQYPQQPQQPAPPQYPYGSDAPAGAYGANAGPGAPAPQQTNTLAVLSLILGILVAPAGIITGHLALSKIKRTGEAGRGLALAGTIIGYVGTALAVLALVITLIATFVLGTAAVTAVNSGISQLEEYESLEVPEFESEAPGNAKGGELLDTPEKILAVWDKCDLVTELDESSGMAFYDDAEWVAAHEALAQLLGPGAESDAILAYVDHMINAPGFDFELTSAYVDALASAKTKLCS